MNQAVMQSQSKRGIRNWSLCRTKPAIHHLPSASSWDLTFYAVISNQMSACQNGRHLSQYLVQQPGVSSSSSSVGVVPGGDEPLKTISLTSVSAPGFRSSCLLTAVSGSVFVFSSSFSIASSVLSWPWYDVVIASWGRTSGSKDHWDLYALATS